MVDWEPAVIAVALFVALTPGLLFQLPARGGRVIEFGNMETSFLSIFVHTVIYFVIVTILVVVVGIHIYAG